MSRFTGSMMCRTLASAVAFAALAACGGGGGDGGSVGVGSGGGTSLSVGGTVARGAVLAGATVSMTCANTAPTLTITGTTTAAGTYASTVTGVSYPCIGSATLGSLSYRGILFAGGTANFTPLTDMLVETVLAAASAGSGSLTLAQFLAKIQSDSTFAASVTSATAVSAYRTAVLAVVRAQLIASGLTAARADEILAAGGNFDSTPFALGSPLDLVLDNTGAVLLDSATGRVKASVSIAAAAQGDTLATPNSGATGATGATGSTGGSTTGR